MGLPTADVESKVLSSVRALVRRRSGVDVEVPLDADFWDDLGLDSLEVAELSAILEQDLGSDPYSAGIVARTVRQVLDFYERR
jgi:acyl carrier protein